MSGKPSLAQRVSYFLPTFAAGDARLYGYLTERASIDLEWAGSAFRLALEPFLDERPERFLWLRLLALVHRRVLAGALPELARHYPSVGGTIAPRNATWKAFRAAVLEVGRDLPEMLNRPDQHNEVGPSAALVVGFLRVGQETGLPLRLLEVGASAGLLLRWDHYRRCRWFSRLFTTPPVDRDAPIVVSERRGCDLHPVDAISAESALYLRSMVWAALVEHLKALDEAMAICAVVPASVDRADGAEWLPRHAVPRPGQAAVVYPSLMRASSSPQSLIDIDCPIRACARAATPSAPLAYLQFEAGDHSRQREIDPRRQVEVWLTTWPGGEERLLATCDVNGRNVNAAPTIDHEDG